MMEKHGKGLEVRFQSPVRLWGLGQGWRLLEGKVPDQVRFRGKVEVRLGLCDGGGRGTKVKVKVRVRVRVSIGIRVHPGAVRGGSDGGTFAVEQGDRGRAQPLFSGNDGIGRDLVGSEG